MLEVKQQFWYLGKIFRNNLVLCVLWQICGVYNFSTSRMFIVLLFWNITLHLKTKSKDAMVAKSLGISTLQDYRQYQIIFLENCWEIYARNSQRNRWRNSTKKLPKKFSKKLLMKFLKKFSKQVPKVLPKTFPKALLKSYWKNRKKN